MRCYDCNMEYGKDWIEAVIPDKIWNKIKPDSCGLLCISCISKRLRKSGFKNVPIWLCGMEPLKAMSGDPEDNIELLRNWDQYKLL